MKAGILRQTHPDYDRDLWDLLDCLYEGGFKVSEDDKRLDQLLPRHVNESSSLHDERKKSAAYINYMGDVVDFFAAQLFTKTLTMLPGEGVDIGDAEPYEEFTEDADGEGHDFQELMAKAFISAALKQKAIIAVDFPLNEVPAQSRAAERETGADRPRAFDIPIQQLLDWKKGDDGRFEWCVLHRVTTSRPSPDALRDRVTYSWKVWQMAAPVSASEDGVEFIDEGRARAAWRLFEVTKKITDDPPKDEDEIPEVASGFTSFPFVPLIEFVLPKGLWIGNKIGPLVKEHFQRRSTLVVNQRKSLMAIPVLKLGPEIGAARAAQPSEAQTNPFRGANPKGKFDSKGWVRIGSDDDLTFAEPAGGAYEIEATQLKELVDEVFRVSHLMAQSVAATGSALARSGESKQEDRNATEVVLEAFGDKVSKAAVRVLDCIAGALGDDVFWQATGLSDFRVKNRGQVVDEATKVDKIKIPSKTFKAKYTTQVALRLLDDVSPEDETAIRDELEKAAEEAEKVAAELRANPPQPPPGAPPNGAGQPQPPNPNAPPAPPQPEGNAN